MIKRIGQLSKFPPVGIGTKIIMPYVLLMLVVASVGAYIVTNLVTISLRERFNNQLLDAGRVVAENMVQYEEDRLALLRQVANTEGLPAALAASDSEAIAQLVPQIVQNSTQIDLIELVDLQGIEVYGFQLPLETLQAGVQERVGTDFSGIEDVQLVLDGFVDEFGDKRIFLTESAEGIIIFTVGPVFLDGELVGAAMVGTYVQHLLLELSMNAVAHVTFYDVNGRIIGTTLAGGAPDVGTIIESPTLYQEVITILAASPQQYQVVVDNADNTVFLREVTVSDQTYELAFGDWRIRNRSVGLFSVALPSNFLFSTAVASRTQLSILFALVTIAVFAIGFGVAQNIIRPLNRLLQTATAVSLGQLDQRSGIQSRDEIGKLAQSFDLMTDRVVKRNKQLAEQASRLEAILRDIVDGVIVLDNDDQIITTNPAARRILEDMPPELQESSLQQIRAGAENGHQVDYEVTTDEDAPYALPTAQRHEIGSRVLSTVAAPVQTPTGEQFGTVIVLRDITQQAEAEHLKDAFITSISHELRTPLTVIMVYADLLLKKAAESEPSFANYIEKISKGGHQLERHINQLLNISELQAGTIHLEKQHLDLGELLQELMESWRDRIESNEITLTVHLPESQLWVNADKSQLSWAIENLLSNARNYTPAGGHVTVRLFAVGNEARLDIVDTGVGIAAMDKPNLFKRFFRAKNDQNYQLRGVGLGLFITRSVLELHDGRIWVESELGSGSTFSIALPLVNQ